jgi:hypothetical protein
MSVAVELDELWAQVREFGGAPLLVTVSEDGRPHVVSVPARVDGDALVVPAGKTTRAVLHRVAGAPEDLPSCVRIVPAS